MKLRNLTLMSAASAAALTFAAPAQAAIVVLDFEGVGNLAAVNDFYNGGTDSAGNSGTNYGVNFSAASLGIIDTDAGGTGNFANEPSASTVLFFQSGGAATMNVAAGFDTGFSFFYSSSAAASISVYDGLNGTGNVLATLSLIAQHFNNCSGDPDGTFCNWTSVGVDFAGIAKSVGFGGATGRVAFDDITFGSATPGIPGVPEPASWALMIAGFGLVGGALRRRTRMTVSYA